MTVTVFLPWRGECSHRQRALNWVRGLYAERHPGWRVVVAEAPPGPWCKAAALLPALRESDADVAVVADADVWCDGLSEAVDATEFAPWAIPHHRVHRLNEQATAALLEGREWRPDQLLQRPYAGFPGGGIVVALRNTLLDVPPDQRFTGWGQEDECWAMALGTLVGNPWRGNADLLHLYHPPQERRSRRWGSLEGKELRRRYHSARRHPEAMRQLLEGARDTARKPPLHADLPLPV